MLRALNASEVRAVEAQAEKEFGLSVALLMEQAGTALSKAAVRIAASEGRFLVLCGVGNNGGDGLVCATLLRRSGRAVHLEVVGDRAKLSPETARHLAGL